MKTLLIPLLCVLLSSFITAELDIEIIILNDKSYNETKFVEAVAEFNPVIIKNGTEIPLLLGRSLVRSTGFINPVLCVNGTCYKEADLPPPASPTPAPTGGGPNTELIASAVAVSVTVSILLAFLCWRLMKRKRASIASEFHRVIIRESIDLPPHLASPILIVKMGSKHTWGAA